MLIGRIERPKAGVTILDLTADGLLPMSAVCHVNEATKAAFGTKQETQVAFQNMVRTRPQAVVSSDVTELEAMLADQGWVRLDDETGRRGLWVPTEYVEDHIRLRTGFKGGE